MRIGLLLPSVYMGSKYANKIFAAGELFLNLADGLVDKGHDVYVYASPDTKTKAHLVAGETSLLRQDYTSSHFRGLDEVAKNKSAELITKIEYEVDLTVKAYLHAQENKLDIMHAYHDFMAHYIAKIAPIKTIYTIHTSRPQENDLDYWRFQQFTNDNYVFISKSQLKDFKDLISSGNVAYHGVDTEKFSFGNGEGGYLAFLGRYIEEKGVTDAIVVAKKSGFMLKMVGDTAYRALSYYQTGIQPELKEGLVEDKSFLNKEDRYIFLKNAKALLFPIRWEEPFGMVMVEAMACGAPVVAFSRGSVPEIIRDGLTGFIINSSDDDIRGDYIIKKTGIEGLLEAVQRIYAMPKEEYLQMRRNSRQHVEENFTIKKMVEGYENVYRKVLENSNRA
jgi:glycosyltransferase involved in cell wall biosynthesis